MSDCPSCRSTDTKSKAMVYAGGTRQYGGASSSVGASSSGRISVRTGRSGHTSQSALAAACAPPAPSKMPKIVVGLLAFFVLMPMINTVLLTSSNGDTLNGVFALPIIGLMIFGLFKLYKYLDRKNKQAIQDYTQEWICLRCGTSFKP